MARILKFLKYVGLAVLVGASLSIYHACRNITSIYDHDDDATVYMKSQGAISKAHSHVNLQGLDKGINNNKVIIIKMAEELKEEQRIQAIGNLLNPNTASDDPQLIRAIREHFIDPPSKLQIKMSMALHKTPQADTIDKILNKKENGFYIECGAMDGERSSNSIYFERNLQWDGLLIEMDPSWYMQIKGKNRRAHTMNVCLSPHQYPTKMNFQESSGGQGKLSINQGKPAYCLPLYSIMLAMNRTTIDYFSLDIEGFELAILKTIPFDKLDIKTLSVEYAHAPNGGQEYIDFMESKGYTMHSRIIKTDIFVSCEDFIFVKKDFKAR